MSVLIPPERQGEELEIVAKILAGERIHHYDTERVRKDGTRVAVSLTASPIHGSNGEIVGVSTLARDISSTRRAQELDQFAYVASHDLKEPLILLSAYARMLDERHGDALDDEGRTFLRHVRDEAGRMKAMIDDLLDYSRLETSTEDTSRVELADALDTALRTLAPAIEESGAQVHVQGPLPVAEGSPSQFERVFRNLVGNAVKFRGEAPPVVTISAERGDGEHVVSVRDNGIGVDRARAERIFEVFQRLHSHDQYPGTGMGLAICKRIVERHGGRIWVEPASDGGSVFRFALPE